MAAIAAQPAAYGVPPVRRLAARRGRDPGRAGQALRRLGRGSAPQGSPRAYAHRAVATPVIDQSRRPWRREVATETLPEPDGPDTGASAATERRLVVLRRSRGAAGRGAGPASCCATSPTSRVAETAEALGIDGGHRQEPDRACPRPAARLARRQRARARDGGPLMNDRITDLLDELADDGDRPLRFTPADLRARVRRRGVDVVPGVAAVAVLAPPPRSPRSRSLTGPGGRDHRARPRRLRAHPASCRAPPRRPRPGSPGSTGRRTPRSRRSAGRPSRTSRTGCLDAQVSDDDGTTATFVSPDSAPVA